MAEFPEKPTKTVSSGNSYTFGSGIPIVKSVNGYFLKQEGWTHEKGNRYTKGNDVVEYDGVHWKVNGKHIIEFVHELKQLTDGKNNRS